MTYWISVNPSPRNSPSAKYCGAKHAEGNFSKLSLVVSGSGSTAPALPGESPSALAASRRGKTPEQDPSADHPFSSFFSSFRKRQSVPLAMICCGVALSIPTSRSRRAKKRTVSSASYWRHWPYGISLTTLSARS